jgi:uncharacterized membrane protein YkvA (DUF1232 family)
METGMDFSQFEPTTRRIAEQLFEESLVPVPVLSDELEQYVESLSTHSANAEFVEAGLAEKITSLCWKLISALPEEPDERQHRLTQLAVNYFVLAEDGHDDKHSMIGFDDDLEVVSAVVRELGMGELLEDSAGAD